MDQFRKHYGETESTIGKRDIFHYVYAALHDPVYREKYAVNLKREFPRVLFHADFWLWATWGKQLMDLHLNYETAKPFPFKRREVKPAKNAPVRVRLKADKENGLLILDDLTVLEGVPSEAWAYQLGNRCALEWILDQYSESNPKDLTIREHFNAYRFADYKDKVTDLLARVCTVSVETQKIVDAMKGAAGVLRTKKENAKQRRNFGTRTKD